MNNRYKIIFKYVFNSINDKTKRNMIRDIAMFLLPETVDNLMGRNIEIAKDIYTGEEYVDENYNQDKFTDWAITYK